MNKMADIKQIPAIRFKGFIDEWGENKVGELCDFIVPGRNKPKTFDGDIPWITTPDITNNGTIVKSKIGLAISNKEAKNVGAKIVPKDSIIMSCVGELGLIAKVGNELIINQQLHAFIPKEKLNNWFLLYGLSTKKGYMEEVATKTAVPYMNKDNCNSIPITFPTLPEQSQIGSYFQHLDKLISLHQAKVNKLTNLKKAMLEKMFPKAGADIPEIRFKGFDGAWEDKPLAETFAYLSNNTLARAQLNYDFGLAKNVHYGDVLIKFGELLDAEKEILPYITDNDLAIKYKLSRLQSGDVIIADAAEDETVGKCCEVTNVGNQVIFAGLHTIAIRPVVSFAPKFLGYFMNSVAYHSQLLRLMQGTKVLSISKTAIKETLILYPTEIKEQQKIGTYFQNLDKLITLHQTELTKLGNLKKACLTKMFV